MLNKGKTGMALGVFIALIHAAWAVIVWSGSGQKLVNWIMTLHFMYYPVKILEFNLSNAVMLVIATFVGGYIFGWVFAAVWNKFRK